MLRFPIMIYLLALICGCSGFDSTDADKGLICGSMLSESREPFPDVTTPPLSLSGAAQRDPDGSIVVVINPMVRGSTSVIAPPWASEKIEFKLDGMPLKPETLRISKDELAIPLDIVTVIDTSQSMFWAIEGVKKSIRGFRDTLSAAGYSVRLAGVEFGDRVRSISDFGNMDKFEKWANGLEAQGGGDRPESSLDAILEAWQTIRFARGAQRIILLVTDSGFHEKSDQSSCSEYNLSDLQMNLRGKVMPVVFEGRIDQGVGTGVSPKKITDALGGMYFYLDAKSDELAVQFEISLGKKLSELLSNTLVARFAGSPESANADDVEVLLDWGGETFSQSLLIE